MNEQQMRSFISVAKHKSISRAAEELNISQQGLSWIIRVIETEFRAKFFNRGSGGSALTDLGETILPVVASMLKNYEENIKIINDIIEKQRKTITITHEHASTLTDIPLAIASRLTDINFKIMIVGSLETCMAQVLNGTADLGFCHNGGNFGKLKYIPIIHDPIIVFMSRDHYLTGKNKLILSDLKGIPQIFPGNALPQAAVAYLEDCVKEGFYPDYALKSKDPEVLLAAIRDRTSVVLGSWRVFAGIPNDIIGIPLIYESKKIEMGFLVKPPVKKTVLSFIEAARNYYDQNS